MAFDRRLLVVMTNLQQRLVQVEKQLQIHEATKKRQTERNTDLINDLMKELEQ